jgi:hypothetical protein
VIGLRLKEANDVRYLYHHDYNYENKNDGPCITSAIERGKRQDTRMREMFGAGQGES